MRLRRCSALAATAALALSAGAAAANEPDVQDRIVPGRSIGDVRLGMTLAQVREALGQPEAVIARDRRTCASKDRRWGVIEFGVLAANEKPPFALTDFDDYWKPIP